MTPGAFSYTITGAGLTAYGPIPGNTSCVAGVTCVTNSGNNSFTGVNCISQLNGTQVVGCGTNTTIQAAITNACAASPPQPVYVPAGTYTQNSAFTLCAGLDLEALTSNGPQALGSVIINTSLSSGALFPMASIYNLHIRNFRIHNTSGVDTTAIAFQLNCSQGTEIEGNYVDGKFLNGIVLNPVPATCSTISNQFFNNQFNPSASNAVGCLLDSLSSTDKVVNSNVWVNNVCDGVPAGLKTNSGAGDGNARINEEVFVDLQAFASAGTNVLLGASSVYDMVLIAPTIEGATTGLSTSGNNTGVCVACDISGNTTNISDPSNNFTFIGGRGAELGSQIFNVDKTGLMKVSGIGIGPGVTPVANTIKLTSGNCIQASGTNAECFTNTAPWTTFGPSTTAPSLTLKKGSGGGNYTNATTSYTVADSTNLCFTVTIPTGFKLAVSVSGAIGTATGAVADNVAITDNTACSTANSGILIETTSTTTAAGVLNPFSLNWVITGDGASHNVALQFKTSNGADAATLLNSSATLVPTMVFQLMPSN